MPPKKKAGKPKKSKSPALQELGDPRSLIAKAFGKLSPPKGSFDPAHPWSHSYQDLSTYNLSTQGGVTIEYAPEKKLRIESLRNCVDGYRYYTLAELVCATDNLGTPRSWRVISKVAKGTGDPGYLNSELVKEARVTDEVLTLDAGSSRRKEKLPGAYTCKWALLDGVGRMARAGVKQLEFTLLDEYDELCPNQMLRALTPAKVKTRDGIIDVLSYQHTGTATVPGTYYLDRDGRVLFYVAGMEILALTRVNGKKVGYSR